jgi:hypothetical protein
MKIVLSAVAALLGLCATPALADQYSCRTVNQSAAAFVNTNVPVSKIETNRNCRLAVDGATAAGSRSGAYVGAVNNLTELLFNSDFQDEQISRDMMTDMLVGPFSEDRDRAEGRLADAVQDTLSGDDLDLFTNCFRAFAERLGPQYEYIPLEKFEPMESRRGACQVILPVEEERLGRYDPISSSGALALQYDLGDTVLSLYFPASFFTDARDGNGIFN